MRRVVEISIWIDRRKVSAAQIIVLLLCGCAILLDGFDAQVIGYVAPAIIKDWQIPPASLAGVFSAGTFGILIGCLFVAPLADWFGRRLLIIASVAEFSALTLATTTVHTLDGLVVMRFLTGIGLGACMSNVVALTSEYVPSRLRAAMTTWMFCGYPVGAFVAGLVVANLSATYGWRGVFLLGGVLPLVLAVLAVFFLPESLYYLSGRKGAAPTIVRILRRIDPQEELPDSTTFISGEHREPGLTIKHLFRNGRAFGTILLWIMFFTMLVEVFLLTSWTPTLLNRAGMPLSYSVITMALVQAGGVVGLLCLGPLFDRLGFAATLVPLFVVATFAIAVMGNAGTSPAIIMTAAFLAGAGVMGGQSSLIVLAGMYYPSFIRSTGVGWALGMGRFGAIVGPLVGGLMVQKQWELGSIFIAASTLPLIVGCALLVMNRVSRVGAASQDDAGVALNTAAPDTP